MNVYHFNPSGLKQFVRRFAFTIFIDTVNNQFWCILNWFIKQQMMIKCDRIFRFVYMCFGLLEADMICLCILRSCCRCATEMFEQNMYPITLICVHRITNKHCWYKIDFINWFGLIAIWQNSCVTDKIQLKHENTF